MSLWPQPYMCVSVRCGRVTETHWQHNVVGNSQNFSTRKYIFHCTWFVQFQTNKFKIQGLFKDNLQFSRSKISSVTRLSLTPFWTLNWLKHSAESFVIFHFTLLFLYYFPWQHFAKWQQSLGTTCSCIWSTEIPVEIKKQK